MEAPKRSRKMLAFSDVDDVWAEPGFVRGGMFARPLFPLPIMAFIKDQVVFWPSWGFSFSMNDSQAYFFAAMMSLFFTASAFFHAALFSDDRGERRHSFSACFTFFTAVSQAEFHHGRRDSLGGRLDGAGFLKIVSLAAIIESMNTSKSS